MISSISIDITTYCNLQCLHCLRDKIAPRKHMPLELVEHILKEMRLVGIREIGLTGGEVGLHPELDKIFSLFNEYRMMFNLVSNGFIFEERMFPLLKKARGLSGVCFSLDGATAGSHDMIRGQGSYARVISSIKACTSKNIPVFVKSIMHKENIKDIAETAFLCASLGVKNLGFIVLTPSPHLIEEKLLPEPQEYMQAIRLIKGRIQPSFSMRIGIEGYSDAEHRAAFCNPARGLSIDHEGNLIFCCNLSHPTAGDRPEELGKECLGNINKISLEEGIIRHYRLLGWFMEKRIHAGPGVRGGSSCVDCMHLFGKTEWTKNL